MPPYRKLLTSILESVEINAMPDDFHSNVWILLPLILSADGTTIYDPRYLRSRLFPMRDDVSTERIAAVFAWFEQRGFILPYDGAGRRYLFVPTFARDQGDTSREMRSPYPPPPADVDATPAAHAGLPHTACEQRGDNTPRAGAEPAPAVQESAGNSCNALQARAEVATGSASARAATPQESCSNTKTNTDTQTDTGSKTNTSSATTTATEAGPKTKTASPAPAARSFSPPTAARVFGQETTPQDEVLHALYHAYQRGSGQAITEGLPVAYERAALRQMLDDKRTPADVEACARHLKAGWWFDKMLSVRTVAGSVGHWIAQGRPTKPKVQPRAGPDPARQSPAMAAYRELMSMEDENHDNHSDNHQPGSGDVGLSLSPGQD